MEPINLLNLPNEVLLKIISRCSARDAIRFKQACRSAYHFVEAYDHEMPCNFVMGSFLYTDRLYLFYKKNDRKIEGIPIKKVEHQFDHARFKQLTINFVKLYHSTAYLAKSSTGGPYGPYNKEEFLESHRECLGNEGFWHFTSIAKTWKIDHFIIKIRSDEIFCGYFQEDLVNLCNELRWDELEIHAMHRRERFLGWGSNDIRPENIPREKVERFFRENLPKCKLKFM